MTKERKELVHKGTHLLPSGKETVDLVNLCDAFGGKKSFYWKDVNCPLCFEEKQLPRKSGSGSPYSGARE